MLGFNEFQSLGVEEKHGEILRCLPLLVPLGEDFSRVKSAINSALDKITQLEYDYGINCPKTRSVDDILESSRNSLSPGQQFSSVDNLHRRVSRDRTGFELPLGRQVSQPAGYPPTRPTTTAPPPLLPDIALHTMAPQNPYPQANQGCQPLPWGLPPTTPPDQPTTRHMIQKARHCFKRIALNVGGVRHEVMWKMLEQFPNSRLGKLARANSHEEIMELVSDYSLLHNEYFFDRHPRCFNTILNFYRTGKLHMNEEMCILAFRTDLDYWGLEPKLLESCCQDKYERELMCALGEIEEIAEDMQVDAPEIFGSGCIGRYQKCLWDLIEHGESSKAAEIVSWISMMFVVISTIGMCVNTIHGLKVIGDNGEVKENPLLALNEMICIIWFSLEYVLRLVGAPDKKAFLTNGLNFVDVLAILPYFVEVYMENKVEVVLEPAPSSSPSSWMSTEPNWFSNSSFETAFPEDDGGEGLGGLLEVFRVFKLARILKLARHSRGLQSIIYTLVQSGAELALLGMILGISGLIFASLGYYIEMKNDSGFTDIPTAFYWVVITMTTVGYGEIFPVSGLGKFVGSFCAVSGALTMSLPLPVIVSNFEKYYQDQIKLDQLKERRARRASGQKREEEARLSELGYTVAGADSHLAEMIKKERGAILFQSPSSVLRPPSYANGDSPSPSSTLV